MNEELLKAIHKKFFSDKDYETFKTDFTGSPELRRAVHSRFLADKSTYNQFEIDLGLKQPPVSADPDDDFSEGLKKVPVVGGLLNAGYKAIKRGIGQGASLEEGMNALVEGKGLSADEIQAVALIAQKTKADTESDNSLSAKFSRGEDLSVPELFGFAAETVLQSGAMMIRGLFDSFTNAKTAGIVGGGTAAGAAAGAPIFGITALPAGIAGAMGSVSGMTEASGILFGDIIQTLSDKGLPINSKNVGDLLADDDWMEEVRKKAAAKGIVVGGVDAITGGISAKIGTKAIKKIGEGALTGAAKRKVIAGAAARGVVTEMSGGAGGERLGQIAAGEPYDPRAVAAEALGEIFGVTNVFTPYLSKKAIVEAREAQNKAEVAGVPVTTEEKELAAKPLSIGPLVDAYKADDIKTGITALSDLAVLHTPEDFNGMLDILSKSEGGISAEDMAILSDKFTEAQEIANGFTTPELLADPAKRSRLVEKRLTARYITTEKEKIAAEQAKADPVLKPQFQAQIDELDAQLAEIENTMTAVANSPSIPVVDDVEIYRADLAKMDEEDATEVSRMRELETELLAMGTQIQDDINTGYYGDAGGRYASWFDERGIGEEANQAEKDKSASVLIKGLIGAAHNDEKLIKPISVPKEAVLRMGQGDDTKGREFFKRAREIATELRDLKSRRNPNEMKRRSLIRAEREGRIDKLTETVGDEEFTAWSNFGTVTPERAAAINAKKNTPNKMSARERQMFAAGLPESDVVGIEEYGAFNETQKVSTERVNEIADKKLMGEALSPREEEMAQAAAPQVESVIAQKEEAQRTISVGDIVVKYDKEGNSTGEKYKVKNIITYERGSWKNSDGSTVTDGKKQKQLDNRRRGERKESTVVEYQSVNEEGVATGITYPMGLHDMNHLGERNQVSYRKEGLSPQTKKEQNAVQEQKTDEVLLRNQQVGLQEVGEGNTVAGGQEGQAEGQGQTQETRGQEEKVAGGVVNNNEIDTKYKDNNGKEYEFKITNEAKNVIVPIDGKQLFLGMQGRFFVLARVGNKTLPFYKSSDGTSGKQKGKWYPFFGVAKNGWIIKGSVSDMEKGYDNTEIQRVQNILNSGLRFPEGFINNRGEFTTKEKGVIVNITDAINFASYANDDFKWVEDSDDTNNKLKVSPPSSIKGHTSDGIQEYIDSVVNNIKGVATTPEEKVAGVTLDEIAEEVGVKATNFRDLVRINRELFGQNMIKAAASAVVMDRMIGRMARRAGITKAQMYGRLEFRKSTVEKLPADAVLQKALKESKDIQLVKDKDGNLLAPNGEISNLNETQWRLVRTKAFKNWFGDWENDPKNASQVVDANGEPLVVYHGTNANFTEFDLNSPKSNPEVGESALGIYFTPNKTYAEYFSMRAAKNGGDGNIVTVYVFAKKLFDIGPETYSRLISNTESEIKIFKEELIYKGYDGIKIKTIDGETEYVAFSPNQIKLADGTNTTFDPNTGDIRFQKDLPAAGILFQVDAWHGSPYQFDKFSTAKIGTGEGNQSFGWGLYFTDIKDIADFYARQINVVNFVTEAQLTPGEELEITNTLRQNGSIKTKSDFIEFVNDLPTEGYQGLGWGLLRSAIKKIGDSDFTINRPKPAVYKVALHEGKTPDQYNWIEWDKSPSRSIEKKAQEQFDKEFPSKVDYYGRPIDLKNQYYRDSRGQLFQFEDSAKGGEKLYRSISMLLGSDKAASEFLLRTGIDGVKYPTDSLGDNRPGGHNYVVFDENAVSIKEVIKFQKDAVKARGAAMVNMDGTAIIYALTDPNVSTPVHELVHVFEHYLTDAERKTVLTAAGTPTWTVETSEYFARGFEKYLADGVSPSKSLQKIFEQFKEWLTEIYNGVKNSAIDIELSPQMKELYASMLKFVDEGRETVSAAEEPLSEEPRAERAKTGEQLNKDTMNDIRKNVLGLSELSPNYTSVDTQILEAVQNHISKDHPTDPLLREAPFSREMKLAFDAMTGVAMDAPRQIAMGYAIHKLTNMQRAKVAEIKTLQGGFWGNLGIGSKLYQAREALSEIEDHLDILTTGMIRAGTTLGRALAIRKELLNFNRDTFTTMRQELRENLRGANVNPDDEAFIRELEKKFNEAKAKSQAAVDKHAAEQANKAEAIARRQSTQKRNTRGKSLASSLAELDKIIAGKKKC